MSLKTSVILMNLRSTRVALFLEFDIDSKMKLGDQLI